MYRKELEKETGKVELRWGRVEQRKSGIIGMEVAIVSVVNITVSLLFSLNTRFDYHKHTIVEKFITDVLEHFLIEI